MKKLILFLFLATTVAFSQTPTEQRVLANSTDITVTGLAGQSALNTNVLESTSTTVGTDLAGKYRNVNVQIISTSGISSGAIFFEGCNTLSGTYIGISVYETNSISSNTLAIGSINVLSLQNRIFSFNTKFQFVKCRISTVFLGGTIQAISKFSPIESTNNVQIVKNATAADLQVTATQSGTWNINPSNTPGFTTTGDSGAKTATFNGITVTNLTSKGASIIFNIGAVTGTAPTLVAKIQSSSDSGTTWVDIPMATTATLMATGVFGIMIYPAVTAVAGTAVSGTTAVVNSVLPRVWRVVYTIGGTTPSFNITNVQIQYIL